MPEDGVVIGILKWVALALTLGSTLWGLLGPKPNSEEANGRKRLTPSGRLTLAIILATASVSSLSYRLETALKDRDDANQKLKQQARDTVAAVTKANTEKGLAQLAEARAEGRAAADRERVGMLARETREVLRDLRLSQQVVTGARDNMNRTGQALSQIERVVQPLENLTIGVTWEIPGDTPRMRAATMRLAEAGRNIRAAWQREWEEADDRKPAKVETFPIEAAEELYLGKTDAEKNLLDDIGELATQVNLFAALQSDLTIAGRLNSPRDGLVAGDLGVIIEGSPSPVLNYVIDTGALRFTVIATVAPDAMGASGLIVSYPDIERAIPVVNSITVGIGSAHPVAMWVRSRSRSYVLRPGAIRSIGRGAYRMPSLTTKKDRFG